MKSQKNLGLITLGLLFIGATGMYYQPVVNTYLANREGQAREQAARRQVLPDLSVSEITAEVEALAKRSLDASSMTYVEYFTFLNATRRLEAIVQMTSADVTARELSGIFMRFQGMRNGTATVFFEAAHRNPANAGITRDSPEFLAAQAIADSWKVPIDEAIAAMPPAEYSWSGIGRQWAYGFAGSAFLSIFSVFLLVKRRYEANGGMVAVSFLSDWRPFAAALAGPFSFALVSLFYSERSFKVNLRVLSYAILMPLSAFIGGAGVVKAQKPDAAGKGKSKITKSVTERLERDMEDSDLLTSTTIANVTDTGNGRFFETLLTKSRNTFNTYFLVGQRAYAKGTAKDRQSLTLSPLVGMRTVSPTRGPTTVSFVAGVKARFQKGRFSVVSPLTGVEQPLNRVRGQTQLIAIVKPSWQLTKRFSVFTEWSSRFTRQLKPRITGGIYGAFKATKNLTLTSGYYRNQAGIAGIRMEAGYAW